jgi:hypothetical protein
MSNLSDELAQLRKTLDGHDQFMGGHQILKIRRPQKKVPSWANNDKKIQEFVRRSFPKMDTNTIQRRRAARWAAIIYYYYRQNWTRLQIARELGLTTGVIKNLINHIKRSANGRRANGVKSRKVGDPSQTSFVEKPSEPIS